MEKRNFILSLMTILLLAVGFQNCESQFNPSLQSKNNNISNGSSDGSYESVAHSYSDYNNKTYAMGVARSESSDTSFVRIINPSDKSMKVYARMLNQDGQQIGSGKILVPVLSGNSTVVFGSEKLESIFGTWNGRAKLELLTLEPLKVMHLIRTSSNSLNNNSTILSSINLKQNPIVLPIVVLKPASPGADISYIRFFNPSTQPISDGDINAKVFKQNGQLAGQFSLPQIPPLGTVVYSGEKIASKIGEDAGRGSVVISTTLNNVKLKILALNRTTTPGEDALANVGEVASNFGTSTKEYYLENIPGATVARERAYVRVLNPENVEVSISVDAFGSRDGQSVKLGSFTERIGPNETIVMPALDANMGPNSNFSLESKVGTWLGRARLVMRTANPSHSVLAQALFRHNVNNSFSNISCTQSNVNPNIYLLPNVSGVDSVYVKLTNNTSTQIHGPTLTMWSQTGQRLGNGLFEVMLDPQESDGFSVSKLNEILSLDPSWTGRSRLQFQNVRQNNPFIVSGFLRSPNDTLTNISCVESSEVY